MPFLPTGFGLEVMIAGDDQRPDKYMSKQNCPHCDRRFSTRSGMMAHINTKHSKETSE